MENKLETRKILKEKRANISDKSKKSEIIEQKFIDNYISDFDLVLLYSSIDNEVETLKIIKFCIENKVKLALPKCEDKIGNMNYYYVNSISSLNSGFYGIMEPNSDCKKVENMKNAICVVPAIAFDMEKYRLGYGKGYYDRFIQKNNVYSVGFAFENMIQQKLPIDVYDQKVDIVITEERIF